MSGSGLAVFSARECPERSKTARQEKQRARLRGVNRRPAARRPAAWRPTARGTSRRSGSWHATDDREVDRWYGRARRTRARRDERRTTVGNHHRQIVACEKFRLRGGSRCVQGFGRGLRGGIDRDRTHRDADGDYPRKTAPMVYFGLHGPTYNNGNMALQAAGVSSRTGKRVGVKRREAKKMRQPGPAFQLIQHFLYFVISDPIGVQLHETAVGGMYTGCTDLTNRDGSGGVLGSARHFFGFLFATRTATVPDVKS